MAQGNLTTHNISNNMYIAVRPAMMVLCTGVGLYAHIRSRKRRHSKGEPTKEGAAEVGQAADNSHCSQPPFPIAQTQLPQGGLFEPVGCPPRLSTPGGFSQSSFMQSITSSKKSRSFLAGKLSPYSIGKLGANKTAMHQLESGHRTQHAQHAQQAQQRQPDFNAALQSNLIRSGMSHGAGDTQHAEEALFQEAAAAEAALGSFSRASSQAALHCCHTPAALSLPADAPTAATAEAATQEATQEAAHRAAPPATQRPSQMNSASQASRMSQINPTQQVMSQSGRGVGLSQGLKGGQPGMLPLQGYPAGAMDTSARGLQLSAPQGQSLTQAQVNAIHSSVAMAVCLPGMQSGTYESCMHMLRQLQLSHLRQH